MAGASLISAGGSVIMNQANAARKFSIVKRYELIAVLYLCESKVVYDILC